MTVFGAASLVTSIAMANVYYKIKAIVGARAGEAEVSAVKVEAGYD